MNSKLMTTKELAEYMQLNPLTVYKKVKEGDIPCVRVGRSIRFKKEQIDKWLEKEAK
ncbi:MAG: helix-turn-helix domain-containing protein [Candidatus Ratteibacteria bacterium]|nr:helix-turn-helix domain-containing protein [Candidatus Ratteibacteria bacterium]